MSSLVAAALAAAGMVLLLTRWAANGDAATTGRHRDDEPGGPTRRLLEELDRRVLRSGLEGRALTGLLGRCAAGAVLAGLVGAHLFGTVGPTAAIAAAGAALPLSARRRHLRRLRTVGATSWPRLLEDLRVRTGALGRPIPQALLEVGARGPEELRAAFAAAGREWALTTDFARLVAVLKNQLDDPTADAVCETLLVAQEVGGDVDQRLAALAEDRRVDQRHRSEADARQAGARVARWFVVIVPAGMALAGLRLGEGARAFRSAGAQLAAGVAVAMIVVCWWWAGRIMRLPEDPRVFDR